MNSITLNVEGMHCTNCTTRITNTLNSLNSVDSVLCSLEDKTVTVVSDMSQDDVIEAIEDMGFDVIL